MTPIEIDNFYSKLLATKDLALALVKENSEVSADRAVAAIISGL